MTCPELFILHVVFILSYMYYMYIWQWASILLHGFWCACWLLGMNFCVRSSTKNNLPTLNKAVNCIIRCVLPRSCILLHVFSPLFYVLIMTFIISSHLFLQFYNQVCKCVDIAELLNKFLPLCINLLK